VAARGHRRAQLLSHLEQNPGVKPPEIARAMGTSPANVQNVLRSARRDKVVRKNRGGGYRLASSAPAAEKTKIERLRVGSATSWDARAIG
jgi:DNA-binding IscR family transcriptional regulator